MRTCNCPNCSASLSFEDENREFIYCNYCGSKIMISDYRASIHIVDEAEIINAHTKEKEADADIDFAVKEQKASIPLRYLIIGGYILFSFFLIVASVILIAKDQEGMAGLLFLYLSFSMIIIGGSGIAMYLKYDDKKQKLSRGGIAIPNISKKMDVEALENLFVSMGFKNIVKNNMHDIKKESSAKYRKVETFTIGGKEAQADDVFMPDDKIIINYHGLIDSLNPYA